jgi:hypothetical protein
MKRLVFLLCVACGYRPLYATPSGDAFHVHLSKNFTASAIVAEEVLRGARETLAKEGALASGDGYPRLEIEVLRADETSEGIVGVNAPPNIVNGGQVPKARASELGVVVRAFVTRRSGGAAELDTGDLRQDVLSGAPLGDAVRETWQREDALRAAARRLGGRAALKVLGHPVVTAPVD